MVEVISIIVAVANILGEAAQDNGVKLGYSKT